jgi:hypothetical protein
MNFVTFGCKLMWTTLVLVLYEPMTFCLVRTHQDDYYHSSQGSPLSIIWRWAQGCFDSKKKRLTESYLQRHLYVDVNCEGLITWIGWSKKRLMYWIQWNTNMAAITVNIWYGTSEETSKPGMWGHEFEVWALGLQKMRRGLQSEDISRGAESCGLGTWVKATKPRIWGCECI